MASLATNHPVITKFLTAAIVVFAHNHDTKAQTWMGIYDNSWFEAGNWLGGSVPTTGTVYIQQGSPVIFSGNATSGELWIATQPNTSASLKIMSGATLTASGQTFVGYNGGIGTLYIEGGQLETMRVSVGSGAGGQGVLNITGGGVLTSLFTGYHYIGGMNGNSTGTVLISGTGSRWETLAAVDVGQSGTGYLTVEQGGRLVAGGSYDPGTNTYTGNGLYGLILGDNPTGNGRVTIDGGSIFTAVAVSVGGGGKGTLTIRNGGTLESGASGPNQFAASFGATLAYDPGSEAEVIVEDPGSSWTSSKNLFVGVFGKASMTIRNGGHVSNLEMAMVGAASSGADAGNGTVLVTGSGSQWTTPSLDMAPMANTQAVVTLTDGGTLQLTSPDGIRVANRGDAEINIGAPAAQAPGAPGALLSPAILLVQSGKSRLNLNHSDDSGSYVLDTAFFGRGDISVLAGTTTFSADSPAFSGKVSITGGRLIVDGQFGGTYAGVSGSSFNIGANGLLGGGGTIVGDVTNAGTISPGALDPSGNYSTLTIRGDYIGSGGLLILDTFLGDNALPSTDRLVLDGGTASGDTSVIVKNTGGLGAQTVGDGILVIEAVNGATTAGATFSQGNRIAAGLYEYTLHRGSSQTENWYLSSHYEPPIGPEPTPIPSTPSSPMLPNYRAEVPVYMAAPALASRLGLVMLGTYHDRIGEQPAPQFPPLFETRTVYGKDGRKHEVKVPLQGKNDGGSAFFSGGWARLFGESGSVGHGGNDSVSRLNRFEKHGPSYNYDIAGFQAGLDIYRKDYAEGGYYVSGLYAGYGRIDSDIRAVYGGKAGSLNMDAYAFGAYATRKGASGWYLDGVLQGTLSRDIDSSTVKGARMQNDGWGLAASFEGGYPITLGSGVALEPQAQVIYQHISLDGSSDSFGYVRYGVSDVVYGRLGARLTKAWALANSNALTTWARVNLWHTFGSDAKTTFTNMYDLYPGTMKTSLGRRWAQFGVGVSGQVAPNIGLFATGDYNIVIGSGKGHGVGGRIGAKVMW